MTFTVKCKDKLPLLQSESEVRGPMSTRGDSGTQNDHTVVGPQYDKTAKGKVEQGSPD